jgi:serine/threonine protein phosphatase 1
VKYYAIADLHGRFDLFEKAMLHIEATATGDYKIITLGDYIDRGPDSNKLISKLMELDAKKWNIICLQGNHEAMMVESIVQNLSPSWWIGNGGGTTLLSYGHPEVDSLGSVSYAYVPEDHIKWINQLPIYYETEKQVFVHAGVPDDRVPLEKQAKMQDFHGELKMQWMLYNPTDMGGYKGKHVVHGHHQFEDGPHEWKGSKRGGRTDLDTYAWKTGRLVIGVFDDTQGPAKEFIEVKDGT